MPSRPENGYNPKIQEFRDWVNRQTYFGIQGEEMEPNKPFIPLTALKRYFQARGRLRGYQEDFWDEPVDEIEPDYYRVFAILLYSGFPSYLEFFRSRPGYSDDNLPFKKIEDLYTDIPVEGWFLKNQWLFTPFRFSAGVLSDRQLENDRILPIKKIERIGQGVGTSVYKIVIHAEYDNLKKQTDRDASASNTNHDDKDHTYVLKTYEEKHAEQEYKMERKAFLGIRVNKRTHPNIIEYYGSFKYKSRFNAILQYADKGDLEMYLQTTQPPTALEDIILLWTQLLSLIYALQEIHNGKKKRRKNSITKGLHGDLKPANVLVVGDNIASPYKYWFKIGDFGTSNFEQITHTGEWYGISQYGTVSYGAPESRRTSSRPRGTEILITSSVDIWSLGCIFSEVLVWMVYGSDGVKIYRQKRQQEASVLGRGAGDCFDNGKRLLRAVKKIHKEIIKNTRPHNSITIEVVRLVEDMLTIDPELRPEAQELALTAGLILERANYNQRSSSSQRQREPCARDDFSLLSGGVSLLDGLPHTPHMPTHGDSDWAHRQDNNPTQFQPRPAFVPRINQSEPKLTTIPRPTGSRTRGSSFGDVIEQRRKEGRGDRLRESSPVNRNQSRRNISRDSRSRPKTMEPSMDDDKYTKQNATSSSSINNLEHKQDYYPTGVRVYTTTNYYEYRVAFGTSPPHHNNSGNLAWHQVHPFGPHPRWANQPPPQVPSRDGNAEWNNPLIPPGSNIPQYLGDQRPTAYRHSSDQAYLDPEYSHSSNATSPEFEQHHERPTSIYSQQEEDIRTSWEESDQSVLRDEPANQENGRGDTESPLHSDRESSIGIEAKTEVNTSTGATRCCIL